MNTLKQYKRKVEIARRTGEAILQDGCRLRYYRRGCGEVWSIRDKHGNTIDTADTPKALEYLFD